MSSATSGCRNSTAPDSTGRIASRHLGRLGTHLRDLASGNAALEAAFPTSRIKELAALAADARFMAETISQREREMAVLHQLDQALAAATNAEDIGRIGIEQAAHVLGFDSGAVYLIDQRRSALRLAYAYDVSAPARLHVEAVPIGSGAAGRAVAERRVVSVAIEDYPDRDALPAVDLLRAAGVRSLLSASMIAHGEALGAITLTTRRDTIDDERAMALLGSIATQVALAIAHGRERDRTLAQERMAAVGRLASGVAHELRNPLTIIAARVDMLRGATEERRTDLLARSLPGLAEATARMRRIVAGLSTYSKPASAAPALLDVTELLAATKDLVAAEAKKAEVEVIVETPPGLPLVRGDRSEMMQILLNLANNAIEAMADSGGTLRLGVGLDGAAALVVEIQDTGPGISPQHLADIWEPFFTTKPEGTGLGLSIVRSLVAKQPGAVIAVESVEGKGTIFRLAMPATTG